MRILVSKLSRVRERLAKMDESISSDDCLCDIDVLGVE